MKPQTDNSSVIFGVCLVGFFFILISGLLISLKIERNKFEVYQLIYSDLASGWELRTLQSLELLEEYKIETERLTGLLKECKSKKGVGSYCKESVCD